MPPRSSEHGSGWGSRRRRRAEGGEPSIRLIRNAHIFASAVREMLERAVLCEICADSLTSSQFYLLRLMVSDGSRHIGDVADVLGVSAPAATKTIDKLERLEFVTRQPSTEDRRATLLAPSTKGRRVVSRYSAALGRRFAPIFREFSREDLRQLADLLERFALCLIKQKPGDEGYCLRCGAHYDQHCSVGKLRGGCPYQQFVGQPHPKN